jgi:hypothetical protein
MDESKKEYQPQTYQIVPINNKGRSVSLGILDNILTVNMHNCQQWQGRRILHQYTINMPPLQGCRSLGDFYYQHVQYVPAETDNSPQHKHWGDLYEDCGPWNKKSDNIQSSRWFGSKIL